MIIDGEYIRIRNEAVVANFKLLPNNSSVLSRLRKTTKSAVRIADNATEV